MFLWFSRLRSRENQIVRVGSRRRKINQSQCMLVPTLYNGTSSFVAWQSGRHFATPSLVPFRNDVRKTSAEMPYWSRVTTQNWVVLLIGWSKFPPRLGQSEALYPDLRSDKSSVWNFFRLFLTGHFEGKSAVATLNVGCFLRLVSSLLIMTPSILFSLNRNCRGPS